MMQITTGGLTSDCQMIASWLFCEMTILKPGRFVTQAIGDIRRSFEFGRVFDRPAAVVHNLYARDLHPLAARPYGFGPHRRKSVAHKVEQFGREPCKKHWVGAATRRLSEQLEHQAVYRSEKGAIARPDFGMVTSAKACRG
jgi:hypothetical protein